MLPSFVFFVLTPLFITCMTNLIATRYERIRAMVFNADKRKKLLDAHNKLRNMLQYADDCRTLEMRHLDDMENIIFMLSHEFQFEPQRDDEGNVKYYSDYVMGK